MSVMTNSGSRLPLDVGLISSYCTKGIWHSSTFHEFVTQALPERSSDLCVYPDLYLFMEADVNHLLNKELRWAENRPQSAISLFAAVSEPDIDKIVDALVSNLDHVPPKAVTTFLPEISLSKEHPLVPVVTAAVTNLLRLAVKIGMRFAQESETKAITPVVQMVAGNKLDNVRDQPSGARSEFYIVDADEEESYNLILDRLSATFQQLKSEFAHDEIARSAFDQLKIAFELEPGPLYLLDGPKSVLRFCNLIDGGGRNQCPLVQQKVGFNLDIAHWWLKQIPIDFLQANPQVAKRIFHSHISGHSARAHFGDISLAELSPEEKATFVSWLVAISDLSRDHFSGSVSLEFEAAPSPDAVIGSLRQLIEFVESPDLFLATAASA